MAKNKTASSSSYGGLKLNYKRTAIIGFAFFGILLLWQIYDSWCPTFLTELFRGASYPKFDLFTPEEQDYATRQVQYLVGIVMALDNLAALILLPLFGKLSDKTKTPLGKRMPYILVGTLVCAVAFPFIPVFFHMHNIAGTIAMMAIVVVFAMMYRNPAVALMPDVTPKPLRSKANGVINIMGYIGGALGTALGIPFAISQYLGTEINKDGTPKAHTWAFNNVWAIEIPFLIGSILMVISAVVLFIKVRENEVAAEMAEDMRKGDEIAETVDKVEEDKPMTKANLRMLILILVAEFFWFMADNGIATFMVNFTTYYLNASSSSAMINTIVGGVGSVVGFALGGYIAGKIGRKWSVVIGLAATLGVYVLWAILTLSINMQGSGTFPFWIYAVWFIKGFGMSLVFVNSFPMVVDLCPNSKIGLFTGYYYASSMAAQTVTPIALGTLLFIPNFGWQYLPLYATACSAIALVIVLLLKNVHGKTKIKMGLEAFDAEE